MGTGELEGLTFAHRRAEPGAARWGAATAWPLNLPASAPLSSHCHGVANPSGLGPEGALDWGQRRFPDDPKSKRASQQSDPPAPGCAESALGSE